MPLHEATVSWRQTSGDFAKGTYNRAHQWAFDGGATCPASASPHVVPPPMSDPLGIDPEEAFIAAIAACHMLWFLDIARRSGYAAATYHDRAQGQLTANDAGKLWLSHVDLRPRTTWADKVPSRQVLERLHHEAHENCYIANSVTTRIDVWPESK